MKTEIDFTPVSGAARLRPTKWLVAAGAGALALGTANVALAADECGALVGGAVVCTGASFVNGVTYNAAAAATVTADTGATVTTTTPATNGITINGTGATTLDGAAIVSTSGVGSTGILVTSATGPVSVSAGRVTVTGTGGNAIRAVSAGPVTVTTAGATSVDVPAIYAHSTGSTATVNVTGGTVSAASSDAIDIASATGATVNNSGTIIGRANAVIASGAGAATINNNGTIGGALSLTPNSTVNNLGTFNAIGSSTFGAGSVFNNAGTVGINTGSAVPVAASLSGLTTFNNSGLIDLRNGTGGNTLTIGGNYVGSGNSAVALEVGGGTVDSLVIGGNATGTTQVSVSRAPGTTPIFGSGDIIVAGAGSSAGAFVVAPGSVNAGLVRYDVAFNSATGAYTLVATPSDAADNMARFGQIERSLWNKSADAVTARMQSRRDALWTQGEGSVSGKFWMTMFGGVDNTYSRRDFGALAQGRVTNTSFRQDAFGGQIGLDFGGGVGERGGFAFGLTGGYLNSSSRFGNGPDSLDVNAINGGAYMSFTSGNIFVNGLAKYDHYWMDADSATGGFQRDFTGHSYGARGEVGIRLGGDRFFVEPLAQLSWVHTSLGRLSVLGTDVDFNQRDGLRVKAGGRVGGVTSLGGESRMSYYLGASYVHDFRREGDTTFSNAGGTYRVVGLRSPDAIEGVAGINIASNRMVSGFMEANYIRSFNGAANATGKIEGAGGRAGINIRF